MASTGRGELAPAALAERIGRGNCNPALGRQILQSPPVRAHRAYRARRDPSQLRCSQGDHRFSRMSRMKPPPEKRGGFELLTDVSAVGKS